MLRLIISFVSLVSGSVRVRDLHRLSATLTHKAGGQNREQRNITHMITKEKLEAYYTPRSATESAAIRRRLADVLPGGDIKLHSNIELSAEDIEEIKWDHLVGDADDASKD